MASRTEDELLSELSALREQNAALERRQLELAALLRAHEAISSSLDLEESLEAIVHQASAIAGGSDTWVYVLDEEQQVLRCRVSVSMSREEMDGLVIPLGEGIAGRVAVSRMPLAIADIREHRHLWRADLAEKHGHVAYLGLPVMRGDQLLGVLAFSHATPRHFTSAEVESLTVFARQAAIAVGNARLYDAAQRELAERRRAERALAGSEAALRTRTAQLEAVRTIGEEITGELDLRSLLDLIVRRAADLVRAQAGSILLADEATGLLVPSAWHGFGDWQREMHVRLGEGLVGIVAERRSGMIVNDYRNWPHAIPQTLKQTTVTAALAEPLLSHDRLLGVIALTRFGESQPFRNEDRATLALLADHAAIAIENARLYEAAVRRGSQLEALVAAARSVTSGLDLRSILDQILAEAARISGAPHVKVLLLDRGAGVLRVGALQGSAMPPNFALPVGVGSSGLVAKTGQPVYMADAQNDPRSIFADGDRELGIVTYLGLPIKRGDEVLGVLTFNTAVPRQYSPEELAYLTSFADQAAIAIEKAQLFQQLHQSYAGLQKAQSELIRAEKLRALGQMSAGMAHDLNNILAAILGQVELLRLRARDSDVQDRLRILETAATDAAQVVRRLQDFARQRGRSPLAPIDLAEVVRESLEITRPRWKDELERHGHVIDVQAALPTLPRILGYAPELREVLTNIILNAVDAMPAGGTLSFSAQTASAAESGPEISDGGAAELVELLVTDTGVGMSDEVRQRVFDPFFTTKSGRGMGLGLSVVYGIMERHGGHIALRSAPRQGTTVSLRFRRAAGGEEHAAPSRPMRPPVPRRILVVDDDATVRNTTVSLLRAAGHMVSDANGGATGLERLAEGPLDLVLTDLGMPEMTGWDVARAVRARHPRLPVVLLTGWGEHGTGETPPPGLVDRILAKPVAMNDLLAVIDDLTRST
jgi:GAF domain-containing protein